MQHAQPPFDGPRPKFMEKPSEVGHIEETLELGAGTLTKADQDAIWERFGSLASIQGCLRLGIPFGGCVGQA